jgi:hypothetical protein
MSSSKPIGGYFELELQHSKSYLHADAIALNTGRNCFEYILRANKPSRVYMPKFTCDAMLEPLQKLGIPFTYYALNEKLEIETSVDLKKEELIVYTNYFGLKDEYSKTLGQKYGNNLILDCSQALYFEPLSKGHTFYSPRKFFGIADGGLLYTNTTLQEEMPTDVSYKRLTHLTKRIDLGPEAGYEDFKIDDASLSNKPIMEMSRLTRDMLASIDFANALQKRKQNFNFLHAQLKEKNKLSLDVDSACPMVYPYRSDDKMLRQRLIDNKVFVATYWPNVFDWCRKGEVEYTLAETILPLPIDQRYDLKDIERVLQVVNG